MPSNHNPSKVHTYMATLLAMIAFAANSILCRLALGTPHIDAASFTTIRLVSAAGTLLLIVRLSGLRPAGRSTGDWLSGTALFVYAIMFSFAYLRLEVSAGALILFALVQLTMVGWGLFHGERPRLSHWLGLAAAFGGLVYLVFPGLTAPSVAGSLMMASAGIAWGIYSLRGRGMMDPIVTTAGNFIRSLPLVLIVAAVSYRAAGLTGRGVFLAIASGALASGLGYVIWYYALGGLSATRSASVQLTVPILAAFGGLLFLGEPVSLRLVISAFLILGGVGLTLTGQERPNKS